MAWKTLGDAMMSAIAQGMVDGEMAAATASQPKGTPTKAGAKFREELPGKPGVSPLPAYKVPTDRCMAIALTPRASPRSAVAIHLVVDNEGGRNPGGRDNGVPTYRSSPQERQAREFLKLVVG